MRTIKNLMSLEDRVALVAGGAGHIGAVLGETLAEMGASIVILDVSQEQCEAVARRIHDQYGVPTLPLVADLADEPAVRSAPETVLNQWGGLDILVNCAALVGTSDLPGWTSDFESQSVDTWRRALEINLTSAFTLIQACVPALRSSGHGAIINLGSIYGVTGPDWRLYEGMGFGTPAAYAASKGGLLQLTRWLATTLAPDIRVNAITPGGVYRDHPAEFVDRYSSRTPLGRMATEEDFKGAVSYLASDLSAYVTGHNLMVDGGWTAW